MSKEFKITCLPRAKAVLKILIPLICTVVLLSLAGQFYKYFYLNGQNSFLIDFIDVDVEGNFPTWINTLLLLSASYFLFVASILNRNSINKFYLNWILLAVIFLLLASDEIIHLHEQMIKPFRRFFNTGGYLYYAWIIPAIIFVLIFLIGYSKFILQLPIRTRKLFLISGVIFVIGAIGFEAIGGNYLYVYDFQDINYAIITTAEEFIEMLGISIFIYALLDFIQTEYNNLQITFQLKRH